MGKRHVLGVLALVACSGGSDATSAPDIPAPPTGFTVTRASRGIDVRWNASDGAKDYIVEVAADGTSDFRELATVTTTESTIPAKEPAFSSLGWYTLRVRARGRTLKKSDPSDTVSSAPCDDLFCADARTTTDLRTVDGLFALGDAVLAIGDDTSGNASARITRDAGRTWTASTTEPSKSGLAGPWSGAFARGTLLVARSAQLLRSADGGATLANVTLPNAPAGTAVALWDDGTAFQLVRDEGKTRTLWTSPNAVDWTSQACAACADSVSHLAGRLVGLSYEGLSSGKYKVASASAAAPTVWTPSFDLATTNTPGGGTIAAAGVFLAWQTLGAAAARSTDGVAFTALSLAATDYRHDGTQFVAHDGTRNAWAVSTDGATFRDAPTSSSVARWLRVGDRYVVVSGIEKVLASATPR